MPIWSPREMALLNMMPVFGNQPQDGENLMRPASDQKCTRRRDHGDRRIGQACRRSDLCFWRIGGFASAFGIEGRDELKLFHRVRDKRSDPLCRSSAADAADNFRHWSGGGAQRMANFRVDNMQPRFNLATAHNLARQKAETAISDSVA